MYIKVVTKLKNGTEHTATPSIHTAASYRNGQRKCDDVVSSEIVGPAFSV